MLFNWFKKKGKMVPLDPADSGAKPGKLLAPGAHGKPLTYLTRKPVPAKDAAKINTSESTVIRIGKLGEVLLQYNMVSRENLGKALALQQQTFVSSGPQDKAVQKRKLLGEILIENNFVTEEQLLSAFARHCRIPYIKLNKYGLPKEAIKSVPEDLIIKHRVMPVDKIGSMLMLAVTDPYDTAAVEEVAAKTGLKVKSILCKPSEFAEMVKFYYPHITEPQSLQDKLRPDNFGDEKPGETPADIASDAAPQGATTDTPINQAPPQAPRVGEETAVFKIEELPFPEPPSTTQKSEKTITANIQEMPANQTVPTAEVTGKLSEIHPKNIPARPNDAVVGQVEQAASPTGPVSSTPPTETTSAPEDKKESFLGVAIEDHRSGLPAPMAIGTQTGRDSETAPVPKVSPQSPQTQESESPAQQTPTPTPPPETSEVNGYDTSLIDIQDLITSQEITPDENIEIIPEEPGPIDVAPYIYPTSNTPMGLPSVEVPINKSFAEKAKEPREISEPSLKIPPETTPNIKKDKETARPAPVSAPSPEAGKAENKTFRENPVLVSDDEFLMARQLFTTQLSSSWEKLYHRGKPSHAEKVDESEFVFYTESAIH